MTSMPCGTPPAATPAPGGAAGAAKIWHWTRGRQATATRVFTTRARGRRRTSRTRANDQHTVCVADMRAVHDGALAHVLQCPSRHRHAGRRSTHEAVADQFGHGQARAVPRRVAGCGGELSQHGVHEGRPHGSRQARRDAPNALGACPSRTAVRVAQPVQQESQRALHRRHAAEQLIVDCAIVATIVAITAACGCRHRRRRSQTVGQAPDAALVAPRGNLRRQVHECDPGGHLGGQPAVTALPASSRAARRRAASGPRAAGGNVRREVEHAAREEQRGPLERAGWRLPRAPPTRSAPTMVAPAPSLLGVGHGDRGPPRAMARPASGLHAALRTPDAARRPAPCWPRGQGHHAGVSSHANRQKRAPRSAARPRGPASSSARTRARSRARGGGAGRRRKSADLDDRVQQPVRSRLACGAGAAAPVAAVMHGRRREQRLQRGLQALRRPSARAKERDASDPPCPSLAVLR